MGRGQLTLSEKNKNKKIVPLSKRPACQTPSCTKKTQHLGTYKTDGTPNFRKFCIECHTERMQNFRTLAEKIDRRKLPACEAPSCKNKVQLFGTNSNGKMRYTAFCSTHVGLSTEHLKYRKDYCENIDKRLGFVCTTSVIWSGMLDVDHKNGNPYDNRPRNLQTLCKCCHAYKTNKKKDGQTPGRKRLREAKKNGVFSKLLDNK